MVKLLTVCVLGGFLKNDGRAALGTYKGAIYAEVPSYQVGFLLIRLSQLSIKLSVSNDRSFSYQKTRGIMTGPPPPTYVCNKCGQTGHWYKLCPLVNTLSCSLTTRHSTVQNCVVQPFDKTPRMLKLIKPLITATGTPLCPSNMCEKTIRG